MKNRVHIIPYSGGFVKMILFIIGMFVGAVIGVFSTAIASACKDKTDEK